MASWHNAGGERGQMLTILSVLPTTHDAEAARRELEGHDPLPLRSAVERLVHVSGADGEARHVVSVTKARDGLRHFRSEEHVAVRELVQRWYLRADGDADAVTILSVLQPSDATVRAAAAPSAHPSLVESLVELFRSLFKVAGEDHASLTVLSVLEPRAAAEPTEDEAPIRAALEHLYAAASDRETPLTVLALLGPIVPGPPD